jgi:hypothetical protein
MEALWEKLQFWNKMPKLKEGKDFEHYQIQNPEKDKEQTVFHILKGKYKSVHYTYHGARVVEDNGMGKLEFAYTIFEPGELDIDDLNNDEEFVTIMGDILTIYLEERINGQTRTDDTQELNL